MNIKVFLNVIIAILVVFIIFNLIVPFSTQEGFTEQLTDAEFRSFSPAQQQKLKTAASRNPPGSPFGSVKTMPMSKAIQYAGKPEGTTKEKFTEQLTDAEFKSFSPEQQKRLKDFAKSFSKNQSGSPLASIKTMPMNAATNIVGKPQGSAKAPK